MSFTLSSPVNDAISAAPASNKAAELTPRAMEVIRSLDSRSFGFLDFHSSSSACKSRSYKGDGTISADFIKQGIAKLQKDLSSGPQSDTFKSEVFCQLGHLHLLLEEYTNAVSAYQHYKQLARKESATNTSCIYGIGLIYFHLNSYQWATEAFEKVLSLSPQFARLKEIHLRLGVMFKTKEESINKAMDHFQKALRIPGEASLSKLEIQFHIGHTQFLQGLHMSAKDTFEQILASKGLPNNIKAMTLRQLGWLYHCVPEVSIPAENANQQAIELLKLAVGADHTSGQTWYFLGRCHASQGRSHEAFLAYQQAVKKSGDNQADIWCSIGVLYHTMCQPRDSLHAYVCAVYLNPSHLEAWRDLGCLYEAVGQPIDALICYKNAIQILHVKQAQPSKGHQYIYSRVANLEQYIMATGPVLFNQPRSLPTIKEAWSSLVPQHIRLKQPCTPEPILQLPNFQMSQLPSSFPPFTPLPSVESPTLTGPPTKKQRTSKSNKDPIILNDGWARAGLHPGSPAGLPLSTTTQQYHQHQSPFQGSPLNSMGGMGYPGLGMGLQQYQHQISNGPPLSGFSSMYTSDPSLSGSIQDLPSSSASEFVSLEHQKSVSSLGGPASVQSHSLTNDPLFSGTPNQGPLFNGFNPTYNPLSPNFTSQRPTDLALHPQKQPLDPSNYQSPLSTNTPYVASSPLQILDMNTPTTHHLNSTTIATPGLSLSSNCSQVTNPPSTLEDGHTKIQHESVNFIQCVQNPMSAVTTPSVVIPPSPQDIFSLQTIAVHSNPGTATSNHSTGTGLLPTLSDSSLRQRLSSIELPNDLSRVMPLDLLDKDLDMHQYLGPSSSQESLKSGTAGIALREDHKSSGLLSVRGISTSASGHLDGLTNSSSLLPVSQDSITTVQAGSTRQSPILSTHHHMADTINSLDGRSSLNTNSSQKSHNVSSHRSVSRTGWYDGSTPSPNSMALFSPYNVNESHRNASVSETTLDAHLKTIDTLVMEHNSDSSSGVSSACTKLSTTCSSESSSPTDTISPLIVTSPTTSLGVNYESRFNYPLPSESVGDRKGSTLSEEGDERCDQTSVPYPDFGDNREYMIREPELKPPNPPSVSDKEIELKPKVTIFEVSSKEEAFSRTLHTSCVNPELQICMIRGLGSAVDLDLEKFSSGSLVQTCPDHEMEVRVQMQQAPNENFDLTGRKQVWKCESNRCATTIKEYSEYQKKVELGEDVPDDCELFGSDCTPQGKSKKSAFKTIRFGTNVDLSDEEKWSRQLKELYKLPKFLRVNSPDSNLLTHIGHTILGMNSVQLYMKVPGSRTPGHQENNNFCSVNINIGPGDCEWFAVDNKYWGVIHQLCEKHKINFLVGSWWPILSELYEKKIPVYQFTQYKGDIVWINPGCVHWVQANGVCNNIAWNSGPLTAHQFRMSWERYQWNKIQKVRSIVPMIQLTWNLARGVRIYNGSLYTLLRSLLESSLTQSQHLIAHLQKANIPIRWHGRLKGEPTPCCCQCLDEVFNILFVLTQKGRYLVYCHKCAMAMKKSFTVLQQYEMQELEDILSSFKLHDTSLYRP